MWDLPKPGIEPVFPALPGRFLIPGPPGKSLILFFFPNLIFFIILIIIIFFWPHHMACVILVPKPGIRLAPSAGEVQSLNHWTTREV